MARRRYNKDSYSAPVVSITVDNHQKQHAPPPKTALNNNNGGDYAAHATKNYQLAFKGQKPTFPESSPSSNEYDSDFPYEIVDNRQHIPQPPYGSRPAFRGYGNDESDEEDAQQRRLDHLASFKTALNNHPLVIKQQQQQQLQAAIENNNVKFSKNVGNEVVQSKTNNGGSAFEKFQKMQRPMQAPKQPSWSQKQSPDENTAPSNAKKVPTKRFQVRLKEKESLEKDKPRPTETQSRLFASVSFGPPAPPPPAAASSKVKSAVNQINSAPVLPRSAVRAPKSADISIDDLPPPPTTSPYQITDEPLSREEEMLLTFLKHNNHIIDHLGISMPSSLLSRMSQLPSRLVVLRDAHELAKQHRRALRKPIKRLKTKKARYTISNVTLQRVVSMKGGQKPPLWARKSLSSPEPSPPAPIVVYGGVKSPASEDEPIYQESKPFASHHHQHQQQQQTKPGPGQFIKRSSMPKKMPAHYPAPARARVGTESRIAAEIKNLREREDELKRSRAEMGLPTVDAVIDQWRRQEQITAFRPLREARSFNHLKISVNDNDGASATDDDSVHTGSAKGWSQLGTGYPMTKSESFHNLHQHQTTFTLCMSPPQEPRVQARSSKNIGGQATAGRLAPPQQTESSWAEKSMAFNQRMQSRAVNFFGSNNDPLSYH